MTTCRGLLLDAPREASPLPEAGLARALAGASGTRVAASGERRLRLAVLADAVACLQRNASAKSRRRRRLFLEAETWIMESDYGSAFSFESVCEALGLDPEYLRDGVRQWCDQQSSRSTIPRASVRRRFRRGNSVALSPQSAAAEFLERCLQDLGCTTHESAEPGGKR